VNTQNKIENHEKYAPLQSSPLYVTIYLIFLSTDNLSHDFQALWQLL
jgi:hypothetical protein